MADPKPIVNPTAKVKFQAMRNAISAHRAMMETDTFERAIAFAEMEYTESLCRLAPSSIAASSSEIAAAACFQRIMGMHEFIRTLRNLSETPTAPARTKTDDNLQHKP